MQNGLRLRKCRTNLGIRTIHSKVLLDKKAYFYENTDSGRLMCNSHYVRLTAVWKCHNFSIAQNLWKIDFGYSTSAKSTIFFSFFTFQKQKFTKITKFRALKLQKSDSLTTSKFSKNDMTKKSWNFHIVCDSQCENCKSAWKFQDFSTTQILLKN